MPHILVCTYYPLATSRTPKNIKIKCVLNTPEFLEAMQLKRSPSKLLVFIQTDLCLAVIFTASLCWHDQKRAKNQRTALFSYSELSLESCYTITQASFAHKPQSSSNAPSRLITTASKSFLLQIISIYLQFPTLSNSFGQAPDNKVSDNKVALHLPRSKLSLGHSTF